MGLIRCGVKGLGCGHVGHGSRLAPPVRLRLQAKQAGKRAARPCSHSMILGCSVKPAGSPNPGVTRRSVRPVGARPPPFGVRDWLGVGHPLWGPDDAELIAGSWAICVTGSLYPAVLRFCYAVSLGWIVCAFGR